MVLTTYLLLPDWRIKTTYHTAGGTKAGFGLTAYGNAVADTKICNGASWVNVDNRPEWQMDWIFEKQVR